MHIVVSILYMVWGCYLHTGWGYMLWDGLVLPLECGGVYVVVCLCEYRKYVVG